LDDPSHRAPPYPPGAIVPQPHYPPQPHAYPPQYPPPGQVHVMPGVSVQISNVVGPMPGYPQPHAYPQPYPQQQHQPGVVDMMRVDASQRAMEAVARRGPARVLATVVGAFATVMTLGLLSTLLLGASVAAVLFGSIPLAAVAVIAFVFAARSGRGVASHHLEQSILELASRNAGVVRVVSLAQMTGRSLRECQTAIDAMVHSGHATVEADDQGALVYRIPDLEPKRVELTAHVVPTERGR
jgi:hypothetical protein